MMLQNTKQMLKVATVGSRGRKLQGLEGFGDLFD